MLAEPLTAAELRVLELLPTHLSSAEIGETLHISRNTVKAHARSIYRKLDVGGRSDAVERAPARAVGSWRPIAEGVMRRRPDRAKLSPL